MDYVESDEHLNEDLFTPFRYKGKTLYKRTLDYCGTSASLIKTKSKPSGNPNVVFIHGLATSWSSWMNSIRDFDKKFDVYVYDMPWSGLNSCDFKSLEQLIDWLLEIFKLAAIENPIIVAHSYGGSIMLNTALRAPKGVISKLILCSVFWCPEYNEDVQKIRREYFKENYRKLIYAGVLANIGVKKDPEIVQSICDKALSQISEQSVFDYYDLLLESQGNNMDIENMELPILIINGANDKVIPVSDSFLLSQKIKLAKYICIEDAEHFPMDEKREEFYNDLYKFC